MISLTLRVLVLVLVIVIFETIPSPSCNCILSKLGATSALCRISRDVLVLESHLEALERAGSVSFL